MPIRAFCSGCQAEFHLQEDSAGTKVRCGTCLNVFDVPLDAPSVSVQAPVLAATRVSEGDRPRRDDDLDRPRRRRDDDDDYNYDRPSLNRRRYRRPDNNSGRTVLLVLGLVFGIKFAIIAIVVVFALIMAAFAPAPAPPPNGAWGNNPGPVFVNDPGPWQPAQPQPWPQQQQFNRPGWQPPAPQPVAPRPPVAPGPRGVR